MLRACERIATWLLTALAHRDEIHSYAQNQYRMATAVWWTRDSFTRSQIEQPACHPGQCWSCRVIAPLCSQEPIEIRQNRHPYAVETQGKHSRAAEEAPQADINARTHGEIQLLTEDAEKQEDAKQQPSVGIELAEVGTGQQQDDGEQTEGRLVAKASRPPHPVVSLWRLVSRHIRSHSPLASSRALAMIPLSSRLRSSPSRISSRPATMVVSTLFPSRAETTCWGRFSAVSGVGGS